VWVNLPFNHLAQRSGPLPLDSISNNGKHGHETSRASFNSDKNRHLVLSTSTNSIAQTDFQSQRYHEQGGRRNPSKGVVIKAGRWSSNGRAAAVEGDLRRRAPLRTKNSMHSTAPPLLLSLAWRQERLSASSDWGVHRRSRKTRYDFNSRQRSLGGREP
jgi:hypothetical protein